MGEGLEYHMPTLGMVVIQFIYAGMTLLTRAALLHGMSPRVFIVYRHIFATIVIAPIAYFSGYLILLHYSLFLFYSLINSYLSSRDNSIF
jgi:hypothetical protein